MPLIEVGLLALAASAFVAMVGLVVVQERAGSRRLATYAAAHHWGLRQHDAEGCGHRLRRLVGLAALPATGLYLAGQTGGQAFQVVRAGRPTSGRLRGARPMRGRSWTFVHLRLDAARPDLHIRPRDRFRMRHRPAHGLSRRFAIQIAEGESLAPQAAALLTRPRCPPRVAVQGRDLVVAFPFGVATPEGVENLLGFARALERALYASEGRLPAAPVVRRAAVPIPTTTPA